MALTARIDRAVRYACAVCSDLQISRLPVDPLSLGQIAGISVVPYSAVLSNAGWFPGDLPGRIADESRPDPDLSRLLYRLAG